MKKKREKRCLYECVCERKRKKERNFIYCVIETSVSEIACCRKILLGSIICMKDIVLAVNKADF